MADTTTDTTTTVDLNAVVAAVVELMRSGVRPDVLEAQRILLHRLATSGDVFPSRIPAPRNITEVGATSTCWQTWRSTPPGSLRSAPRSASPHHR